MRTMTRGIWACRTVLFLAAGIAFATGTRADDCYRYISYDGAQTEIDVVCAQQLGITPIFVRDATDGYDILVPQWSGATSAYGVLAPASMEWLSNSSHLTAAERVIDFAENTSDLWPLTSEGGEAKIEYVNYTLSSWLNTSGASTTIANITEFSGGTQCSHIHVCTSCEVLICPDSGANPLHLKCSCGDSGQSCCVIHRTMEPPVE